MADARVLLRIGEHSAIQETLSTAKTRTGRCEFRALIAISDECYAGHRLVNEGGVLTSRHPDQHGSGAEVTIGPSEVPIDRGPWSQVKAPVLEKE